MRRCGRTQFDRLPGMTVVASGRTVEGNSCESTWRAPEIRTR